jgi:hypothetical protein
MAPKRKRGRKPLEGPKKRRKKMKDMAPILDLQFSTRKIKGPKSIYQKDMY